MALTTHETLSLTTVASPATTKSAIVEGGCSRVLMSTANDVRFTVDGATTPIITAAAEVGTLLRSTDAGIVLSIDQFLNLKIVSVSGTARVQFEFLDVTIYSAR